MSKSKIYNGIPKRTELHVLQDKNTVYVDENGKISHSTYSYDGIIEKRYLDIDYEEYGLEKEKFYIMKKRPNSVRFITDKPYTFEEDKHRTVGFKMFENVGIGLHNKTALSRLKVKK